MQAQHKKNTMHAKIQLFLICFVFYFHLKSPQKIIGLFLQFQQIIIHFPRVYAGIKWWRLDIKEVLSKGILNYYKTAILISPAFTFSIANHFLSNKVDQYLFFCFYGSRTRKFYKESHTTFPPGKTGISCTASIR